MSRWQFDKYCISVKNSVDLKSEMNEVVGRERHQYEQQLDYNGRGGNAC